MSDQSLDSAKLYGILDLGFVQRGEILPVAKAMLKGGVQMLQLRAKKYTAEEVASMALEIYPLAKSAGVPFVINDFPQLAGSPYSDGVHIGQEDGAVSTIRAALPTASLLGRSTHSVAQAVEAANQAVDYIGFGPLFATTTKPDYAPIGVQEIREVHERVKCPIFCIGGIKLENLGEVIAAGARRVVIVSGILQASDICGYCRRARALLDGAR